MPSPIMSVMGQSRDEEEKKSINERVKDFLARFDPRDRTLGANDLYSGNPYG
tara:strand:+ start:477 stop:632 length:156 start_codon:yes stop_codon:yes gene_type:complete